MKNKLLVLLATLIMVSCSASKYSYYFDHHNYNAGKKRDVPPGSLLAVAPELMVASTSAETAVLAKPVTETTVKPNAGKTYFQMDKSERKAFRHQVKKDIKSYVASRKKSNAAKASSMDHELKLAIIFGVAGIVFLAINTELFTVIGAIALIIGLVFFVKWLIRQ